MLAAGRLSDRKGFDLLIEALRLLLARGADLALWIAGEVAQRLRLERQIASAGLEERVRLLGWRADLPALLEAIRPLPTLAMLKATMTRPGKWALALTAVVVVAVAWAAACTLCGYVRTRLLGPPYGSDRPHSGWEAVWVGDVDGDEVPDYALLTRFEPGGNPFVWGTVRIIAGATGRELRIIEGLSTNDVIDRQIGALGDIGGHGKRAVWLWEYPDRLIIAPGIGGPPIATLEVERVGILAPIGDVDGDGELDILASGFRARRGDVETISAISISKRSAIWSLPRLPEKPPGTFTFEWKGCPVGDVNGDGITDAAVVDEDELILIVDGRSGQAIRKLHSRVDWGTGEIDPLGDVDGDGVPEVLVFEGWSRFDRVRPARVIGELRVVSCLDGRVLLSLELGYHVRHAFSPGDVDGDGRPDIAWQVRSALHVVRSTDGQELHVLDDVWCVGGLADYDRDGCADLLVTRNVNVQLGEETPDDLWKLGRVEIISGRDGSTLTTLDGSMLSAKER